MSEFLFAFLGAGAAFCVRLLVRGVIDEVATLGATRVDKSTFAKMEAYREALAHETGSFEDADKRMDLYLKKLPTEPVDN